MFIKRLQIENIRSIETFDMRFPAGSAAGWHVILGDNGSGKSSVIRSIALALTGPRDAPATRQSWSQWLRHGAKEGSIAAQIEPHDILDKWQGTGRKSNKPIAPKLVFRRNEVPGSQLPVEADFGGNYASRTIWGSTSGWFSASFGPFRRFSGGDKDYDRLFYTNPRLAPHLSAFGEEVALTEALRWLQELQFKTLEKDQESKKLLDGLRDFLNKSELLPHGAVITDVNSQEVIISDGDGFPIPVEQMSDGYRSILSMTFELLRGMVRTYGAEQLLNAIDIKERCINLPGVVAIDEIDAHLHPAWQKNIGQWFIDRFPLIQFFVTTHSPIICRASVRGTIWRLPTPGTEEVARQIDGEELNRLLYGSILDAFGTEFFGVEVTRSDESKKKLLELAQLNRLGLKRQLTPAELQKRAALQAMLPSRSALTADS